LAALFAFLAVPMAARSRAIARSSAVDAEYVSALGAANRFLHAWQTDDQETALLMLTDNLRQHTPEDRLDAFFAQHQPAYEIGHGKKLGDGHYRFPVTLFATPGAHQWTHARNSQIEITRAGKNEWIVDKLP
jgi:hypothetical protein